MATITKPTVFLLHALGSSKLEWQEVITELGDGFDCIALDLPGFGGAASSGRTSVADMVDWLGEIIRSHDPAAYMIVGHSMGGKIATLLAARAEAGAAGLSALAGIVLVAGSPPSPEPMDDGRRAEMIAWFADERISPDDARAFVRANIAGDLTPELMNRAASDVRRCGRHAWLAWLERGSREDWSAEVGRLRTPALVIAGAEDGDLGGENQRRLNVSHYPGARVEVIAAAAHLLPYERPDAIARAIAAHWLDVSHRSLPPAFAGLLASPRVSERTRSTLIARLDDPTDEAPTCIGAARLPLLAALVDRVLPGARGRLDLARRLDAMLAQGKGDGWRFADLPRDDAAWKAGLDTLAEHAPDFVALPAERQDAWLDAIAAGEVGSDVEDRLPAGPMRLWFEDVRAESLRAWLAHPDGMARIGYDGFANGGDGSRLEGYQRTGADDPEPWEPAPVGRTA